MYKAIIIDSRLNIDEQKNLVCSKIFKHFQTALRYAYKQNENIVNRVNCREIVIFDQEKMQVFRADVA